VGGAILYAVPVISAADLPTAHGNHLVVIAHRGEHQSHHENTLEAVRGAIEAGADYVELDIRRTADGHHVLMHDSNVDRMTDGKGKVVDLTWDQLRALHVQDRRLTNVPPSRIPEFAEALALCPGKINIYVDFKNGDRAETARMIREARMEHQVIIYDGAAAIAKWREVAPEFPVITSPAGKGESDPIELGRFLDRFKPEVIDSADTAELVQAAKAHGTASWPDIQRVQEGPEYWRTALARGMAGVQTDHPVELVLWLKENHLR
jgi:glycerophosphoryl diester phosphodiesterase